MSHPGDETRQKLLEAAGEVFAAKGFQAATVREICGLAEANLAAVNYHFGDKERLYIAAVCHAHSSGGQPPPAHWPPGTPPEDKLRQYVEQVLRNMLEAKKPAWHAQLMVREMFAPTAACVELVEADIRPRMEALLDIVGELVPAETAPEDRHLIAFSIIAQCLFFHADNRVAELLVGEEEYHGYGVQKLSKHIAGFSLAAIRRGQAPDFQHADKASAEGRR
jgi:AcrR family transcriptional regulator